MSRFETVISATGSRGNIFSLLGNATRMLKQLSIEQSEIDKLRSQVMGAGSYTEALDFIREWFPVDADEA